MPMKKLIITLLLTTLSHAQIYNSFMCYTQTDTVVLFGVLKRQATLQISYGRLEQNPTIIDLKMTNYNRQDRTLAGHGVYKGKEVISFESKSGWGHANIDLTGFAGTEDIKFNQEEVLCYFGLFED
jgi:hypothetical protein